MSTIDEELAALVADVRAVVQAQLAAGHVQDPIGSTRAELPADAVQSSVDAPATLTQIRDDLGDCRRCGLCAQRTNLVFGAGDTSAPLMVIGEAPGKEEDLRGEPFVGAAGEMLDKMLERVIGLPREQVYIANVVKCRPPKNRDPLPDEVATCLPFLQRQIRAVRPKVLLVLGRVAFQSLLQTSQGITRARGRWFTVDGVPTMPTFHPAYLLRKPQDKRLALHDLQAVAARLRGDQPS